MNDDKIRIGIIGIGNCASSLIQSLYYCKASGDDSVGVMNPVIGGYRPEDIECVAAWDIDARKVGKDLSKAIWAKPNCTQRYYQVIPLIGTQVRMGKVLDGIANHMTEQEESRAFQVDKQPEPNSQDVIKTLKENGVEVVINFLPVGSQQATEFYAECALEAGVAFINAIPVFIASNKTWNERFMKAGLPIIGDDIKAQIGATVTHRALTRLFEQRGVHLNRTYQLNIGGNTDFLNMVDQSRLTSKRLSKTEAVQSVAKERLSDSDIRIGPSDYIPWLNDNKVAFMRLEGQMIGGVPMNIEVRLSVEDSPNAAAVALDAVRCARVALDRNIGGYLEGPSAFLCKHPPVQYPDEEALALMQSFLDEIKF